MKNNVMKNMNLSTNQTVYSVMKRLKLIQKLKSNRAILSGLTPYVRGLLLSHISRSSFIFIPLNLDFVTVAIPPVSFSLSKANKYSWGKQRYRSNSHRNPANFDALSLKFTDVPLKLLSLPVSRVVIGKV